MNPINNFLEDKDNWILWLPVFFTIGIIIGFYQEYKSILLIFLIINIIFLSIYKKFIIILPFIFLIFGFLRSDIYIKKFDTNFLEYNTGYVDIEGKVEDIEIKKNFQNKEYKELLIKVDKINLTDKSFESFKEKYNEFKIPQKVIVRLDNKNENISYGYIKINTILFPISEKIFTTSFDFKRYYYFKNIGAVGYKGKIIENIPRELTLKEKVNNFKNKFIEKEQKEIQSKSIDIVMALLTGNQKIIDKDVVETVNYAGISHILSISGLHMITLMGLVFFIVKWILLRSEYIALNFNVFKISSFISLLINFVYLAFTGFSISAVRSYIMNVILLLAVMIERFNCPLRSVMFVGLLMLFVKPDMVFNPSFQMSFIAVIALTGGYEFFLDKRLDDESFFNHITRHKFLMYIFLSFITSMLAELSTTPFSIYHFNNYTFYNVISNFFTVPITTFFVLPFGILAIPLYFFDLEKYILIPVCKAMDLILYMSEYINNIPNSIIFIKSPNVFSISLMLLGILWFCLWSKKWRLFGIIFYLLGILIIPFQKTPDIIINHKDKTFIVKNDKNNYFSRSIEDYNLKTIVHKLGEDKIYNINDFFNKNCKNNCPTVNIYGNKYIYSNKNKEIKIINTNNFIKYYINDYKKIIKLKNVDVIYL